MIEQLIAEATECDFKVALETKKPKSWLKSVSAFSNGIGGTLFFGVSDDREPIGLSDVQKDAEAISRLIKERITPLPQFILKPLQEDGKNLLALDVSPGRSTPYYYKADGVMEAYIRVGNESVIAPDYIVNEPIRFFSKVSTDVIEAAKLDGANEWQIFWRIGIPLGMPGIMSVIVLAFLEYWNLIEQPAVFLQSERLKPLSLYLSIITKENAGVAFVAALIALLPPLLVFLCGRKYLEQGIAAIGGNE